MALEALIKKRGPIKKIGVHLKAIQLDPWNAEYRLTLGRFYRKRGLKLRARKQFEEVLQIAPAHEGAAKELDTLD